MTEIWNCFGPPGTGKTERITKLFVTAAQQYGAQNVAAVTYSKAAAGELKTRVAEALGIRGASEARLKAELPWVGTIHSLCYAMLGKPQMVKAGAALRFLTGQDLDDGPTPHPEYASAFDHLSEEQHKGSGRILRAFASARNANRNLEETCEAASWHDLTQSIGTYYIRYDGWKKEKRLVDFEDLLWYAADRVPKFKVLIVDEAQDNSWLTWRTLDAWGRHIERYISVGDPFQAVYVWSGADPRLFMQHPGTWFTLDTSHRLPQDAVEYANQVLKQAGWDQQSGPIRFIDTWHGIGGEGRGDGSTLYLARTGALLNRFRQELKDRGEPYSELRGRSPLESPSAQAYVTLIRLEGGGAIPIGQFNSIATMAGLSQLHFVGSGIVDSVYVSGRLRACGVSWPQILQRLDSDGYYHRIVQSYGIEGLIMPPATRLGTIHAAKGLEADHVKLVTSWATLPFGNLATLEGQLAEACVAYVGVTRQRVDLELIDVPEGRAYPWP